MCEERLPVRCARTVRWDRALVATIACDAIGAQNVYGVSMPSSYSSEHSKSDARELAERTGLRFATVPIGPMVQAFLDNIELTGLAEENLQARARGVTLMGLSTIRPSRSRDRQQE